MKRNYIILTETGPATWRDVETKIEVRIFEDGVVAESHAALYSQLNNTITRLVAFDNFSSAESRVLEYFPEGRDSVWIHHFILPVGFHDRYPEQLAKRNQGAEV